MDEYNTVHYLTMSGYGELDGCCDQATQEESSSRQCKAIERDIEMDIRRIIKKAIIHDPEASIDSVRYQQSEFVVREIKVQ